MLTDCSPAMGIVSASSYPCFVLASSWGFLRVIRIPWYGQGILLLLPASRVPWGVSSLSLVMSLSSAWSTEQFDKEYTTLHPEQKLAVDTVDRPIIILGGPGTGKTRLLAIRIANILRKTGSKPGNILCLTSSETGIITLRNRLELLIGPNAYQVNIYTFQGLCEVIMKDNPHLFEAGRMLPLSDLERIQLLTRLIDAFPKGHPLKRYRGDVYSEVNNLPSLFSIMIQEGWTPDYISQQIDEYLHQLPNRPEFTWQ